MRRRLRVVTDILVEYNVLPVPRPTTDFHPLLLVRPKSSSYRCVFLHLIARNQNPKTKIEYIICINKQKIL